MKFLFAAVHCIITAAGEIVVDPSIKEMVDVSAQLTFVFDSVDKNIIASLTEGSFGPEKFHESISKCRRGSDHIFSYYRDAVKKYSSAL